MSRRPVLRRPSVRTATFAAVCGVMTAVFVPLAAAQPAAAMTVMDGSAATSAWSVIESVGVNVHLYYNDTSYADTNRVTDLLSRLGVRHVRDGLAANRPDDVAAIQQLGAAGIRSTLLLSGTAGPAVDPNQIAELDQVAPYVDAVEPTNEYDCSGDTGWAAHLHAYTQSLVQTLQSSDTTRQLGILAPGFCRPDSVTEYGSVAGTASATNAHDYSGGQPPELALEGRLPAWSAMQQSGLPMAVTETGYQNALASGPYAVTEATAADYTVRALLDAQRLGIARTYLYELMDEKPDSGLTDPEQHYGLVRADGTVKPAYTAVQNLLADLAQGPPAAVQPGGSAPAMAVSLQGGGSLLRSLVVTDPSGGGQTVALWLATPLENTTKHTRLADAARTVRIGVDTASAAVHRRPSRNNSAVSLGTGTSFDVPVDGEVTLVHLAPVGGAATACTPRTGYADLAGQLGATTGSILDGSSGWTATPAAADPPAALDSAVQITGDGQQTHVTVPGSPTAWTVAMWERTDASSAPYATFLQATGAAGALLRTYDLADDIPSHMQVSAYGLPPAGASYGNETWGQALPGTWHLLSLSIAGSTATFAVDGAVQGTVPSTRRALTGVDVGSLSAGFRGALGGLEVFPRALTADELGQLATAETISC